MASSKDQPKGQNFLLTPECRTLTFMDLAKIREATAYKWFMRMRWPETDGEPYCPGCGTLRCYAMTRGRFKCSATARKIAVLFHNALRHGMEYSDPGASSSFHFWGSPYDVEQIAGRHYDL